MVTRKETGKGAAESGGTWHPRVHRVRARVNRPHAYIFSVGPCQISRIYSVMIHCKLDGALANQGGWMDG